MPLVFFIIILTMPLIKNTTYQPAFPFTNRHFNTVFRTFYNPHRINFRRERLELEDGDFLDLDCTLLKSDKVVIAIHGLEGSSNSTYIHSLATLLHDHGIDMIALNLRSCSGVPNRLYSSYHSGKTRDLHSVITYVTEKLNYQSVSIVGYSLGGNMAIKYMGEYAAGMSQKIKTAIGVSVPCDLEGSAKKINLHSNRLYRKVFMKSLLKKLKDKVSKFPQSPLTTEDLKNIHDFKDFDNAYTAPAHGFKDAVDYWHQSSCKQFIPKINKPTLLITAMDDPFLTKSCYPFKEAEANTMFYLLTTQYGGHVGFGQSLNPHSNNWCEKQIINFINSM